MRPEELQKLAIGCALVVCARQHDKEWSRVHRAVISSEGNFAEGGHLSASSLVENLAGLGVGFGNDGLCLSLRQITQHAFSQGGICPQVLHGRDDAVPAEH